MQAKRAENFWKNCHVFPNSRNVKVRLFIFFSEEDRLFIFQLFQDQNIYFQNVPAPPPSESNGCPLKEKNIVLAVHESIFSWKAETLQILVTL